MKTENKKKIKRKERDVKNNRLKGIESRTQKKEKKRKREKNSWVTTPIHFFHNCSCGYLLAMRFRMVNIWYKIKPMGCEKEKVIRRGLRRPFIRTKR